MAQPADGAAAPRASLGACLVPSPRDDHLLVDRARGLRRRPGRCHRLPVRRGRPHPDDALLGGMSVRLQRRQGRPFSEHDAYELLRDIEWGYAFHEPLPPPRILEPVPDEGRVWHDGGKCHWLQVTGEIVDAPIERRCAECQEKQREIEAHAERIRDRERAERAAWMEQKTQAAARRRQEWDARQQQRARARLPFLLLGVTPFPAPAPETLSESEIARPQRMRYSTRGAIVTWHTTPGLQLEALDGGDVGLVNATRDVLARVHHEQVRLFLEAIGDGPSGPRRPQSGAAEGSPRPDAD